MGSANLLETIECVRTQLVELTLKKGNFVDDEVVALSKKLDVLICQSYRKENKKALIA